MTLFEVLAYANDQLRKYYEELPGWNFVIDYNTRGHRLGQCRIDKREIAISDLHAIKSPDDEVKNTILHEIAHALDWVRNHKCGHNRTWRNICVEVGARPERQTSKAGIEPRYITECETCARQYFQNFISKRKRYYCPSCVTKPHAKPLIFSMNKAKLQQVKDTTYNKEIVSLLEILAVARQHGDKEAGRKIRAKLRKLGHRGGLK